MIGLLAHRRHDDVSVVCEVRMFAELPKRRVGHVYVPIRAAVHANTAVHTTGTSRCDRRSNRQSRLSEMDAATLESRSMRFETGQERFGLPAQTQGDGARRVERKQRLQRIVTRRQTGEFENSG